MKYITDEVIESLYEEFDTPSHVRAHCKGVTRCALRLADALLAADPEHICLDRDLLYGAGMVHDMARRHESHDLVAADRLTELGYTEAAEIVRGHMRTMTYHDIDHVTEADLLYISDRMVIEDTFAGPEKRMEYLREKMIRRGYDPDSERARTNRRNTFDFVKAIERKTGKSVFEICG